MANLPATEKIDLLTFEIYDESSCRDDTLIWLSPEEESSTLNRLAELFESLPVDSQDTCGPASMALDCFPGEQPGVFPDSAHHQSSAADVRLHAPYSSEGASSVGISIISSPLTYRSLAQFNSTRWLFRLAALVSVLLIGSTLPSILEHMRPTRVKASAAVSGPSTETQSAGRPRSGAVRVLTVMVGRDETVRDISVRFVGYFDGDLFDEICKLNPDLKDPDHLEEGGLIRIPLRPGMPVN